jgi:hypothetical protein
MNFKKKPSQNWGIPYTILKLFAYHCISNFRDAQEKQVIYGEWWLCSMFVGVYALRFLALAHHHLASRSHPTFPDASGQLKQ